MDNSSVSPRPSLNDFLDSLFLSLLKDERFDQNVVQFVCQHLGQESIHTQAGKRLAKSIIDKAKERSREENR